MRVVRSPDIGVIGVGEGTTPNFPRHLFDYLGISRRRFYELAEPTWKLGIRFLWGSRGRFDYSFCHQLDSHWSDLPRPNGFYCDEDFSNVDAPAALMREDKVFHRQPNGAPDIQPWHAFHIENEKFVAILEVIARETGVEIIDDQVTGSERGPQGVAARASRGRPAARGGFLRRCQRLPQRAAREGARGTIREFRPAPCSATAPWSAAGTGTGEPILPYTTAEQMDAGWAWQIEHEHHVNRGYVYCSQAISDDDAAEEFLRKNPKAPKSPRVVKFRCGCYRGFGWTMSSPSATQAVSWSRWKPRRSWSCAPMRRRSSTCC